jgi:hypothetical protein
VAGAAVLIVFFYVDELGIPYTGYGRYLMFPYVLLGVAALLAVRRLLDRGRRAIVVAAALFVAACQAQPLAHTLALDFGPDYARNSLEWHRCLIRLPFRELVSRIPRDTDGATVQRIRLASLVFDTQITSVAYPDLERRYRITGVEQSPSQLDCRCHDPAEAVFAGFEYRTNFERGLPSDPAVVEAQHACEQQVVSTCKQVLFERDPAGVTIAALGVGVR